MKLLRVDQPLGLVRLGDTVIPGVYQSLEVAGKLKVDEVSRAGRSGASKLPEGWEDQTVRLRLELVPDEDEGSPESALAAIGELFRRADKSAKPTVYRLVHPVCAAMGLREVLFTSLRVEDTSGSDTVVAELELKEFRPVALKRESRARKLLKGLLGADGLGSVVHDVSGAVTAGVEGLATAGYDLQNALTQAVYDTLPAEPSGAAGETFEADPEADGPWGIF